MVLERQEAVQDSGEIVIPQQIIPAEKMLGCQPELNPERERLYQSKTVSSGEEERRKEGREGGRKEGATHSFATLEETPDVLVSSEERDRLRVCFRDHVRDCSWPQLVQKVAQDVSLLRADHDMKTKR